MVCMNKSINFVCSIINVLQIETRVSVNALLYQIGFYTRSVMENALVLS